jgi:glycosyltransferase involved in cell wall biosynthesis
LALPDEIKKSIVMMKVAFISRSSLFTAKGGDTVQMQETARCLKNWNVDVDIRLTGEKINYQEYDLLHFFNLTRPADILFHIKKSKTPFVVTPLLIDYSEFDQQHRKGISGKIFHYLSSAQIEYFKSIARWTKRQEKIRSFSYLVKGYDHSIKYILLKARMVLPNSEMEYENLAQSYSLSPSFSVIPNGIDTDLFSSSVNKEKDPNLILSVARIEGLKNQLNLIKAVNDSRFQLFLIGNAAINQTDYYKKCKKTASPNIHFIDHLPQKELIEYYQKAKVHILPSWFETCGLSTLEAASLGCNVVITNRGYASEYCNGHAFYCDPSSPVSIREAIEKASKENGNKNFREKIFANYTWKNAAQKTFEAYKKILLK